MRAFFRWVMLLSLGLWLGAIFFFSIAVAPSVFGILGSVSDGRTLAGDIVGRSLAALHYLGLTCGLAYVSAATFLRAGGRWLVLTMAGLTLVSQFLVTPHIHGLRAAGLTGSRGFQAAHAASTSLEAVVFLAGLAALWRAARQN